MTLRELFSKSAELLWQNPRLLLPVLLADGVKFVLSAVEKQATGVVIRALLPKSVLGGYAGPARMPASIWMAVGAMNLVTYLVCIMGFVAALGLFADWVPRVQIGSEEPLVWRWPQRLRKPLLSLLGCTVLFVALQYSLFAMADVIHWRGKFSLYTLLALSVGAASAVFGASLHSFVDVNGATGKPMASRWQFALLLLFGFALSEVLSGEILLETGRDEGLNLLLHQPVGWLIGLFLSLLSAIPFAWSFVGMSLRSEHTEMATSSVGENECFE
ncbi:hypothetical protein [Terriglobus roseus]|uniref:Uncharacterized protein n=1 Tax=Terriglobus roseus TaxID=392734 RepID=A0A1G7QIG7_9BACT|nr:hypothetical protein [Terriglobus roseus]SDF98258.1 hypothetical protein SAMN05444167_3882 [Terriglobus roseus]